MPTQLTTLLAKPSSGLMDRLRFPQKLMALGAALALGWIALLALLVPRLLSEQRQVDRELSGVEGIIALGDFMEVVQDHRRAIRLYSKGDTHIAGTLPAIDQTASTVADRFDNWLQGPGCQLGLSAQWQAIRTGWQDLATQGTTGNLADSIERHNQTVAQATSLINAIADNAGLALDPELSTTYLSDLLSQIPPMGAELTIVRGTGWGALIDGHIDDTTRIGLVRRSTLLRHIADRIVEDADKAVAQNADIQAARDSAAAMSRAIDALMESMDRDLLAAPLQAGNAAHFRQLGDAAWQRLGELRSSTSAELTRSLTQRAARVRHQAWFTLVVSAAAALLTAVVFLGFMESVNRSLDVISQYARRLARGDFPEHMEFSARDEMSEIAAELEAVSRSLKAMTEGLQQALALQSAIADSSNLGMMVTDETGLIVSFNRAAQQMLGYGEHEVIGSKRLDFFHDTGELAVHARELSEQLGHEVPVGVETLVAKARTMPEEADEQEWSYIRHDGSRFPVLLPVTAFRNFEGRITGFLAVAHDITERKQKDLAIARSLREKDTLLKEVYHRVKNNLQVISSLFDLQLRTLPEGPVNAALKDGASRVRAMALVHEKLYQSGTLSSISLQTYIDDLCERLGTASSTRERGIQLITEAEAIEVSMDTAVPLGLWINEVISNSLKHGFPDGRQGTIRVKAERDGDNGVAITISDDGIGFDAKAPRKTKSLGMKLVAALSEQLDGRYSVETDGGVTTRLSFPLPPP